MLIMKKKEWIWEKSEHWDYLMQITAQAANLSDDEYKALYKSPAAEIIAAIAFISDCKDKERVIISHLTTVIAAVRCRSLFNHRSGETLAERLLTCSYYPEGQPEAVKAGMLLLQLLALNDYNHDLFDDIVNNKYNPLAAGLDYKSEKKRIMEEYRQLPEIIKEKYKLVFEHVRVALFWWP